MLRPRLERCHRLSVRLDKENQQTNHNGEEGNTFDQGGCDNHVGTDVSTDFRLTCQGFQSTFTDVTDTQTCADGSDTGTDTGTHFT